MNDDLRGNAPLTEAEFNRLYEVLAARAVRGAMSLEGVDGLFCALVAIRGGPLPREYLPVIWGAAVPADVGTAAPIGEGTTAATVAATAAVAATATVAATNTVAATDTVAATGLLQRYWRSIAAGLARQSSHQPFIVAPGVDGVIGRTWARGFMLGVSLAPARWTGFFRDERNGPAAAIPLVAGTADPRWPREPLSRDENERLIAAMIAAMSRAHRYFAAARREEIAGAEEMLAEERAHLDRARAAADHGGGAASGAGAAAGRAGSADFVMQPADSGPGDYSALCFSGGGIRSAAFSMGVLQAFAESGLMTELDYLSAVSGGGYALGWWSAIVKRVTVPPMAGETAAQQLRRRVEAAQAKIRDNLPGAGASGKSAAPRDPIERSYVRAHGNYLTIRTGLASADTWAALLTMARNLVYGLSGLGLLLVLLCYVGICIVAGIDTWRLHASPWLPLLGGLAFSIGWGWTNWIFHRESVTTVNTRKTSAFCTLLVAGLALICIYLAGLSAAAAVPYQPDHSADPAAGIARGLLWLALLVDFAYLQFRTMTMHTGGRYAAPRPQVTSIILLLLATIAVLRGYWPPVALLLADVLGVVKPDSPAHASIANHWLPWFVLIACHAWEWVNLCRDEQMPQAVAGQAPPRATAAERSAREPTGADRLRIFITTSIGLVVIFVVAWFLIAAVLPLLPSALYRPAVGTVWVQAAQLLVVFAFGGILWNSLISVTQGAQRSWLWRELWSRWGAKLLIGAAFTGVGIAALGVAVDGSRPGWLTHPLWAAGAALLCLVLAAAPAPTPAGRLTARVLGVVAVAFTAATAVLIAADMHRWVTQQCCAAGATAAGHEVAAIGSAAATVWILSPLVLLLPSLWVVLRSGPNTFSMHELYKNRLVRAFLGASNPLGVIPAVVDFCAADDLPLAELSVAAAGAERRDALALRPFPVWSATVNVTDSSQIGLQERKSGSFSFTPLRCGYDIASADRGAGLGRATVAESLPAFARTARHGRNFGRTNQEFEKEALTVGMVMATSGAAFSSNTGATTKPERALLATLLGLRLGVWLPNPANVAPEKVAARFSPWSAGLPVFLPIHCRLLDRWFVSRAPLIFREALSRCDVGSDAVYVTDGGHFENLGIYEMIRRRVRLIVATDAGCDPAYRFADLLNLQTRVRTDFGVELQISGLSQLSAPGSRGFARSQIAVWDIIYHRDESGAVDERGHLIYCKSTLTGREDSDLLDYKRRFPSFPHLSTVNQWFAESTFEAYRALGLHIGRLAAREFLARR